MPDGSGKEIEEIGLVLVAQKEIILQVLPPIVIVDIVVAESLIIRVSRVDINAYGTYPFTSITLRSMEG